MKDKLSIKNILLILFFILIIIFVAAIVSQNASEGTTIDNIFNFNPQETYVNISKDGALKFNTTGLEVHQWDFVEDEYTGQFDNKTFYELINSQGFSAMIVIHHSSVSDSNSSEAQYLHTNYYMQPDIVVKEHDGYYYSISIDETNDTSYFNYNFLCDRIVDNTK